MAWAAQSKSSRLQAWSTSLSLAHTQFQRPVVAATDLVGEDDLQEAETIELIAARATRSVQVGVDERPDDLTKHKRCRADQ